MMTVFKPHSGDTTIRLESQTGRERQTEAALPQSLLVGRVELAALLDIATATLDRLVSAGEAPAAIKLGGRKLWRREDVDEWVKPGCPDRKVFEALTKGCS